VSAGPASHNLDVRLARIVDLWPHLPRGTQAAILAMAETEAE
jgi:hypothetical protein